jgi:4-diphosphocytidyl-2-C-methyl-D-erythritol kinase
MNKNILKKTSLRMQNAIIARSFAKINLFLEITGKNSKNYHLIDSLMAFIDIFDIISVEKSNKLELEIIGEQNLKFLGKKEDNILIKTANLFAKKYNFTPNINIKLEKNIPIAAGLGGGSANAATLIEILIKLYDLKISREELREIALEIGSDVPFCLHKKIALVSGVGEIIRSVDIDKKNLYLLIINPKISIDTGKIFQNYQLSEKNTQKEQKLDLISMIKCRKNHLEQVAIKFCPKIVDILENLRLQRNIISAKLSGSGATCFGVFVKKSDLDLAFDNLKSIFPEFYIKKTKLLYSV